MEFSQIVHNINKVMLNEK